MLQTDAPLLVVLGPTGSGKSELALSLAEEFDGEIVNCDSVQLYRFLDIGSAKTPPHLRRGIPHHLIDVLNPDEHYTAGDYSRAARSVLDEITARGRLPVVVGGTGFYLRALLEGLSEGPVRDEALRSRLLRRNQTTLHRMLRRFDPAAAARIHPNDVSKLVRALEVCILSRQPVTQLFQTNPSRKLEGFRVIKVSLDPDREALAERINQRSRQMFVDGLAGEVRGILDRGYASSSKALMSIGYREALLHVQGLLSLEQAIVAAQTSTRQYAKRQRTWFRREPDVFRIAGFGDLTAVISAVDHSKKYLRS